MIPLGKIKEIASARGDKNALIFDGMKISWNEYYKVVKNITLNLASKIDYSSEISMCYISPNCLELIYLMSAASSLKIPCTGIDYTQNPRKLDPM